MSAVFMCACDSVLGFRGRETLFTFFYNEANGESFFNLKGVVRAPINTPRDEIP